VSASSAGLRLVILMYFKAHYTSRFTHRHADDFSAGGAKIGEKQSNAKYNFTQYVYLSKTCYHVCLQCVKLFTLMV